MRVPTKVSTSIPYPVQLGAPAAAPAIVQGAGFFDEIDKLSSQLKENQQKKQVFDLNAAYTHEVGAMDQDFQERKDTSQPGAAGFALQTVTDYTARHQALLQGLEATKKYTSNQLQQLSTQLEEKRNSFIVPALQWEKASMGSQTSIDIKNQVTDLGQQAAFNPDNINGIREGVRHLYDIAPGLDSIQKAAEMERSLDSVSLAAAAGYGTLHPAETIKAYTGIDPREPRIAVPATGGMVTATGNAGTVANTLRSAGRSEAVIAGFLGNLQQESGNNPQGGLGDGGTRAGIVQWDPTRQANFKSVVGVDVAHANAVDQAKFINWELDNPEKAGMTTDQRDQILAAKSPEEAATLIDKFYERSAGTDTAKRVEYAKGFYTDTPATSAPAVQKDVSPLPTNGKTGISALDNINAEQRFHVLAMAREEFRRKDTQDKTDVEVRHQNSIAQADAGVAVTNPPSMQDYIRAYGPNIGPQKAEELEAQKRLGTFKKGMNTLPDSQIATQVAALKPSNPDTFAVDSKAYTEAQQAASQIISARQTDAAGYVIGQYPGVKEAWAGAHDANGRQAAYTAMNTAYNNLNTPAVNRKPMTTEQASQMKIQFETMPDAQKLATIRSWQNEMGPLFPQGMRQLSDSGLGVETYLADTMKTTPSYGGTAVRVLQGLRIMKENPALMPDEKTFKSVFTSAINPQTQVKIAPADMDAVMKSAMALYVADGGQPGAPPDASYLRQALGGDKNNSDTGWMNGGLGFQTILPAGVTGSSFTHWKDGLTGNDLLYLGGGDYPRYGSGTYAPAAAIVNNGVFVKRAPDRYEIHMMPDGGTLRNKDGSPYIMVITPDQVRRHF